MIKAEGKLDAAWRSKAKQLLVKAEVFARADSDYRRMLEPGQAALRMYDEGQRRAWIRTAIIVGVCFILFFFMGCFILLLTMFGH